MQFTDLTKVHLWKGIEMTAEMRFSVDKKQTLDILSQLIRIRTVLPQGDEMDMVKYILSLFPEKMLETKLIDHGNNRASLVASLPGANRGVKIALIGHMDTFPIIGVERWNHPPFAADYDGGVVYGRGASNMKGGIAAMLMVLLAFVKEGALPPCDVVLCLTADGDNAALTGARALAYSGYLSDISEMIFAEATGNKIAVAQRGGVWLHVRVTGKPSYACIPGIGMDALSKFIEFHSHIKNFVGCGRESHQYLGEPLCTITQLNSGVAMNVIAPEADGTIDIRLLPLQDNDEVIQFAFRKAAEMMAGNPPLKIVIEVMNSNPAVGMPEDSPMIRLFEKVVADFGGKPEKSGLLYYTDACAMVPVVGAPFLLFGPGDNIYHTMMDESVSLDSVVRAAEILIKYILERGARNN